VRENQIGPHQDLPTLEWHSADHSSLTISLTSN
jgi:hypothetical protein